MKALSLRCLSSSSRNHFVGFRSDKGLRKLGSLLRIMQASQEFFGLIVFTLHPFGCVPQLKLLSRIFQSGNLSVALHVTLHSLFSFQGAIFQPLLKSDMKSQLPLRSHIQRQFTPSLVGPSGLEPPTLRLSVVRSSQLSYGMLYSLGGDSRDRTGDLLLARQALSQLSYIPSYLSSSHALSPVPSKLNNVTLVPTRRLT